MKQEDPLQTSGLHPLISSVKETVQSIAILQCIGLCFSTKQSWTERWSWTVDCGLSPGKIATVALHSILRLMPENVGHTQSKHFHFNKMSCSLPPCSTCIWKLCSHFIHLFPSHPRPHLSYTFLVIPLRFNHKAMWPHIFPPILPQ